MSTLKIGIDWMDKLLPEGLPLRTSTILSGAGGSGKPLIGDHFVASWMRAGGSVVFLSLQYPSVEFLDESLKIITGLDLGEHRRRMVFLSLDVSLEGMLEPEENVIKVNLVKPGILNDALEKAFGMIPGDGPGILVFGSAINLLLFSPTYGEALLEEMVSLLRDDKRRTYIFSVSNNVKPKEIARLESAADNLIMARSENNPIRLYMTVRRMKGVPFLKEEIQVPIPPPSLEYMKQIADHNRKRIVPQVSKI
ncbi:MAG: hypothetical protein JW929_04015 [Anaerolineales bacterium]|nr:hypothetical protein [Anaerolineales bacterium]